MNKIKSTYELIEKIIAIILVDKNRDPNFADFREGLKKCLIYPTDDLYLDEEQFIALDKAMNEKRYYVMQFEEIDQIYNQGNCIFEFSSYEDYKRVYDEYEKNIDEYRASGTSEFNMYYFWSKTILFSESLDWILQITEADDGGIGLLGGKKEKITRFMELYGRCNDDLLNCEKHFENRGMDIYSLSPALMDLNDNL